MPQRRGSVSARYIAAIASAARTASASSRSPGRTPYPSSKSTRRSSIGPPASFSPSRWRTARAISCGAISNTAASSAAVGRCRSSSAEAASPHSATVPAVNASAGT